MNGALLELLETLNKAGGMDVLSPMFKDMGENGSRAIAALSTLASKIDFVKSQQEAANVAFEEGTSIDKEFAVQNNTVQASLEKCKNAANDLRVELGERLYPLMKHMLSSSTAIMRAMLTTIRYVSEHRQGLILLTAAITTYTLAVKAQNLVENIAVVKVKLLTKWTKLYQLAQTKLADVFRIVKLGAVAFVNVLSYLKNGLEVTYTMQERWRKSMSAMKFSSWVGLILAVGGAVYALHEKFKSAREEAARLRKEQEEYKRSTLDIDEASAEYAKNEELRLKTLYEAATNEKNSKDKRREAAEKLQNLYPEYFKNLSTEEIMVGNAKSAYDKLRDSIIEVARARAAAEKIQENEKKLLVLEEQAPALKKASDAAARKRDAAIADYNNALQQESNTSLAAGNSTDAAASYAVDVTPYALRVNETDKAYQSANRTYQQNLTQQRQLNQSNQYLKKRYNVTVDQLPQEDESTKLDYGYQQGGGGGHNSPDNTDRFAAEKDARDRAEASARISYAQGEKDYVAYTNEMNQIAVDFYKAQLSHSDLSATERLQISANLAEAQKKQQEQFTAESIEQADADYNKQLAQAKQFYLDGSYSKETYDLRVENLEIEHQKKLISVTKEGSKERLQAETQLQNLLVSQMERKQREREKLQQKLAQIKSDYFGDNPSERESKMNEDLSLLEQVYNAELLATGENADEKLRIEEAYQQARLAIQRKYGAISENDTKNSMQNAVDNSIAWLDGDGGKAMQGAMSTMVSGMSSIFSQLSSLVQSELEIQTAAIEAKYEAETDAAQGNSYKVAQIEKKKEAEIAKAKNEANRKLFAMQVIQAVAQTAQNALNAYGSAAAVPVIGYILAPIAAAMAVAAGTLQVAAIKKQQQASEAQGYAEGGFTKPGGKYEPAGIVHAGEWVASQELLSNPVARPMIEALDYAQRTNTIGSLRAEDVSRSITANDNLSRLAEQDSSSAMTVAAMVQNSQAISLLTSRLNEPFVTVNTITGDKGIKQAQDEYDQLVRNKTPKSRRK
jgi:hypothetical protein